MSNQSTALTERQSLVMDTLGNHITEWGYPPTVVEMAEIIGISPAGIQGHLKILDRKGFISLRPFKSRAIKILKYA